jgi:hypothetical protein
VDRLDELLTKQRELMRVLGVDEPTDFITSPLYKDVLIMMGGEVQEALEPLCLSTKPWKVRPMAELREHAVEELIDVLFFWLEAANLVGLTSDQIKQRYDEKWSRNLQRAAGRLTSHLAVAVSQEGAAIRVKVTNLGSDHAQG